jgi:hypothetical protein
MDRTEAVSRFAEGLRCRLGQLAGNLTHNHQQATDAGVDGAAYFWRAEGVREAIRIIQEAAEEARRHV